DLVVHREGERVPLARVLQPPRRETMSERAILGGERRVRRLAQERVLEAELVFAREFTARSCGDDLVIDEIGEPLRDLARARLAADERHDAAAPERLTEDARRAQHATRAGREPLE